MVKPGRMFVMRIALIARYTMAIAIVAGIADTVPRTAVSVVTAVAQPKNINILGD